MDQTMLSQPPVKTAGAGPSVALLAVLAAMVSAALVAQRSPLPSNDPALVEHVVAARHHIAVLSSAPRPSGSAAHSRARDYIRQTLGNAGIETNVQWATVVSEGTLAGRICNIVGTVDGLQRDPIVLLVAHYDSTPTSPGAADDALGTAAVIEAMRYLKASGATRYTAMALFTDGEEAGVLGMQAFVRERLQNLHIAQVINIDARGSAGPSLLFEVGNHPAATMTAVASVWRHPRTSSIYPAMYRLLPYGTDFSPLRHAGLSGVNLANIDGAWTHHVAYDTVENLSAVTIGHAVEGVVRIAERFAQGAGDERADAVFFDILGFQIVQYTPIMQSVLTVVLLISVCVLTYRTLTRALWRVVGGLMIELLSLVAIVAAGIWLAPIAVRAYSGSEPRLLPLAAAAVVLLVWGVLDRAFRRRTGGLLSPGVLIWAIGAVAMSIWMPPAAYLLVWPLLITVVGSTLSAVRGSVEGPSPFVARALTVASVAVLICPILFWTSTADVGLGTIATIVATSMAASFIPDLRGSLVASAGLVLAMAAMLALAPRAIERPTSSVAYLYDARKDQGLWVTSRAILDPPDQVLFREPQDIAWMRRHPMFRGVRAARAATVAVPTPRIVATPADFGDAGQNSMRFHVVPAGDGGTMFLSATGVLGAVVDGEIVSEADIRAATRQNSWGLRFVGVPRDGIDVLLSFGPGVTPTLDVLELRPGLPPETLASWPRPLDVVSRPGLIAGCTLAAAHYGS